MRITTSETYTSFTQFRKRKNRFENNGFKCVTVDITKSWGRIKIVAEYWKEGGSIADMLLVL